MLLNLMIVSMLQEVAKQYNVEAMPTFIFVKDGAEVDKIVGADKNALTTKVTQHASPASASA